MRGQVVGVARDRAADHGVDVDGDPFDVADGVQELVMDVLGDPLMNTETLGAADYLGPSEPRPTTHRTST